jgi:hypothetical protein
MGTDASHIVDAINNAVDSMTPAMSFLPLPNGECPTFMEGDVVFHAVSGDRKVQLWMPTQGRPPGPLIFCLLNKICG